MPVVGRITMTLDTQNHPATHHLARVDQLARGE